MLATLTQFRGAALSAQLPSSTSRVISPEESSLATNGYIDTRDLDSSGSSPLGCPVSSCTAPLETVDSQWGEMPYCPKHRIRVHAGSRTFVYYNGSDRDSKRNAALRNILFEREYFRDHILGNAAKAETHRMSHETSEDALTWNVFTQLATSGMLAPLVTTLTGSAVTKDPELYLWGLKVHPHHSTGPLVFPALQTARDTFEAGISHFLTEPDIMLYVPGEVLVVVEAKFTSGNTVATRDAVGDVTGEKPKSREGIVRRYSRVGDEMHQPSDSRPFYSQLYRNLVFAMHMAAQLDVRWALVNLVSERQCGLQKNNDEYTDPTESMRALLPDRLHDRFSCYSWERLYNDHVAPSGKLTDLAEYMRNKSANGVQAFSI